MKIYKEIDISIEKYRSYLELPEYEYSKEAKEKMNRMFDLFESGQFQECLEFVISWREEDRYMIFQEIWEVLMNVSMGVSYKI